MDNMRKCEHTLTNWDRVKGVVVMYVTDLPMMKWRLSHLNWHIANQDNDRHRPHTDMRTHMHILIYPDKHVCIHSTIFPTGTQGQIRS